MAEETGRKFSSIFHFHRIKNVVVAGGNKLEELTEEVEVCVLLCDRQKEEKHSGLYGIELNFFSSPAAEDVYWIFPGKRFTFFPSSYSTKEKLNHHHQHNKMTVKKFSEIEHNFFDQNQLHEDGYEFRCCSADSFFPSVSYHWDLKN